MSILNTYILDEIQQELDEYKEYSKEEQYNILYDRLPELINITYQEMCKYNLALKKNTPYILY